MCEAAGNGAVLWDAAEQTCKRPPSTAHAHTCTSPCLFTLGSTEDSSTTPRAQKEKLNTHWRTIHTTYNVKHLCPWQVFTTCTTRALQKGAGSATARWQMPSAAAICANFKTSLLKACRYCRSGDTSRLKKI